ncbi:DNA polymerase III, delta prime subunit [Dickeya chrysanthemi Ech1591]|uniref:DNA polymerase III subunit delta' n=1 Tax=Dickeya chrysanthemi (strain Ech1591) TaxID=561229 RepID=C6CFD2_DICC1|nr:DNA polymerase III subunit delta' [Dickeya chrysanthemi]ACT06482.1 DNA polymerase III, delta prime subunit [Dickeya chrysanthemi Ech1591]
MEWYSWLNAPYRQLLASHQAKRGHHALLLYAIDGMGDASLAYAFSRWLLCRQPEGAKSCGRCHACELMNAGTHPDWHTLIPEKGKQSLGVDAVREVLEQVYQRSRQGGAKVIWLPRAESLTEAAANALLKTLEEPPAQTYFLLGCREPGQLLATLRSRCLHLYLDVPTELQGMQWLRTRGHDDDLALRTALWLSAGAPLAADALLQPECWAARQMVCQTLSQSLQSGDALALLSVLNHDDADRRIHWISTLFMDALKWRYQAAEQRTNQDQALLIAQLASQLGDTRLHHSLRRWLHCRHQLLAVTGVNRELLLTELLLAWESVLSSPTLPVPLSFS